MTVVSAKVAAKVLAKASDGGVGEDIGGYIGEDMTRSYRAGAAKKDDTHILYTLHILIYIY